MSVFEHEPRGEGADDGGEADHRREPREHEAQRKPGGEEGSARTQPESEAKEMGREDDPEDGGAHQEPGRLAGAERHFEGGEVLAEIRGGSGRGHHRQDEQAEHVVDDRGAQDNARLDGVQQVGILEDASGDPDAGGAERRPDERVGVGGSVRKEPAAHAESKRERSDDADRRDQEGRGSDAEHLADGGLEPHFEEEDQRPDSSEDVEYGIPLHRLEEIDSEEGDVSERDAGDELPQHRGLPGPYGQLAAELGGHQHAGEEQRYPGDGIGWDVPGGGDEAERHGRERSMRPRPGPRDFCRNGRTCTMRASSGSPET